MNNEKYCDFVSSRGIAYNCDVYPKKIISDTEQFDFDDYVNIKDGAKVYVISSVLDKFIAQVFPTMVKNNICITLVTGACVISVPNELSTLHNINYLKFVKNHNKYIKRWYTQNCDVVNNHYIKTIPLGLDYHTLQNQNHYWGPMQSALEQENQLKLVCEKSIKNKYNKKVMSFSYFHYAMMKRNDGDRYKAKHALHDKSFNYYLPSKLPRLEIWEKHIDYHFIISPHGQGLDCHRTWEALMLGCIPIVQTSSIDNLFHDLPVLILQRWSDLNENLLRETLEKFSNTQFNFEKLTLKYWVKYLHL